MTVAERKVKSLKKSLEKAELKLDQDPSRNNLIRRDQLRKTLNYWQDVVDGKK